MENKVVLLTGAAGKLGKSLSKSILDNNGKIVMADINADKLFNLAKTFPSNRVLAHCCDASKKDDLLFLTELASQKFGKIDAAIHSSYPKSKSWGTSFENLEFQNLRDDLASHLGGALIFSQIMIKYFLKQKYGNLIHISSIQGVSTPKFEHYEGTKMISPIEYSAIKAGLISITKYLAKYYKGNNIRVNCISPGGIKDNQAEIFMKKYKESCNNKGMLDPQDISGLALFLISDDSLFINGQNLIVDDGWSL